jgi:hypothetical protein
MTNETFIYSDGKWFRVSNHNAPRVGETFLAGGNDGTNVAKCDTDTWIHKNHPEAVRPILEEVSPPPSVLGGEAFEALRLAATELDQRLDELRTSYKSDNVDPWRGSIADRKLERVIAAQGTTTTALEALPAPPEVQERFTVGDEGIERNISDHNGGYPLRTPAGIDPTEYAAALNELSGRG